MSNDQNRRARLLAVIPFYYAFSVRSDPDLLISFVLVVYASAIELFRYNLATPDGRKFQSFLMSQIRHSTQPGTL